MSSAESPNEPPLPAWNIADEPVNAPGEPAYAAPDMQCEASRLMTAAQAGDTQAFESLMRSLRARSFQFARSIVGSHEDALDLCQEAFLKAFRSRAAYNPSQPFLPWFHRILRNTCFSHLRKHRRLRVSSLTHRDADGDESDFEIVDPEPGPTSGIEDDERRALFQRALTELSARDREILVLRHYQELSYKEIARTLEIPEGTVMSRLFHARRRLRETLAPILDDVGLVEAREGGAR